MLERPGYFPSTGSEGGAPRRKDDILAEASRLFVEFGFHATTMEAIADAVGITARALYRHYDNKEALLTAVVIAKQDEYFDLNAQMGLTQDSRQSLTEQLPAMIDVALATKSLTVLWQREARYLPADDRASIRGRILSIVRRIRDGLAIERPDLLETQLELRSWAVSSTLSGMGHLKSLPEAAVIRPLLMRACLAAANAPTGDREQPTSSSTQAIPSRPVSRREKLLAAAANDFVHRGFIGSSIGEIARIAGIAGPGVYRYFPSKQHLLDVLMRRFDDWQTLGMLRALTVDPESQLAHLVDAYVQLALEFPHLIGISIADGAMVSSDLRDEIRKSRADRRAEIVNRIRERTPRISDAQAAILIAAATSFIDDVARTAHLRHIGDLRAELVSISTAILCSY